jgi:hypothetical protein
VNSFGWFVAVSGIVLVLTGCSNNARRSNGAITKPGKISVFDLRAGDCVVPPKNVAAEITSVTGVPCADSHPQEVYDKVDYKDGDAYPGDDALKSYADARCQDGYEPYVGIAYSESRFYYTYLLPSARGWENDGDRTIVCLVTTTGDQLRSSVRGSKQ